MKVEQNVTCHYFTNVYRFTYPKGVHPYRYFLKFFCYLLLHNFMLPYMQPGQHNIRHSMHTPWCTHTCLGASCMSLVYTSAGGSTMYECMPFGCVSLCMMLVRSMVINTFLLTPRRFEQQCGLML